MSQDVQLQAEKRETVGKKAVAELRAADKVPAIVQEHGKETIHISLHQAEILKAYQEAGKSQPIDLTVGSSKKLALIKEIEFVPLKPRVQHVVFQALKQDEAVDAEVPIHLTGEIPAEANRLVIFKTLESLMVRALPKNLPEALEISGESLEGLEDRLSVGDIKLPEGVELVEILTNAEDEEKQQEFMSQPIVLVREQTVESDGGEDVDPKASVDDLVDSEHGDAEPADEGGETQSENPGGKKANQDKSDHQDES